MSDTARPDPANIVAVNTWLMEKVEMLLREREERRVSATEAALFFGWSESYFRGRPWRIPHFGLRGTMHSISAWRAFLEIPEIDRRKEWDAMPLDERRKARGIA